MRYPWIALHNWQPFKIDALGLVTLLGADEVQGSIGRLVPSRWLEYMPLLGSFVIAGDSFREKQSSFNLYNITSGIHTTDLSCWFTRWSMVQEFEVTRSIVYWEISETPRKWLHFHFIAGCVCFLFNAPLVVMTLLSRDWYGLANAISILASILVRACVLQANRNAIDHSVVGTERSGSSSRVVKTTLILSNSKMVTMFMPEKLIIPVFVRNPQPHLREIYSLVRWIGWVAFAVHAVSLGMAQLACQMYTIGLLIIPTMLICNRVGCDDVRPWWSKDSSQPYSCWIGSRLKATIFHWPTELEFQKDNSSGEWKFRSQGAGAQRSERRQDLYAWLNLTPEEEESLAKWDLLPHSRNNITHWASDFNAKKNLIASHSFSIQAYLRDTVEPQIRHSRRDQGDKGALEDREEGKKKYPTP